MELLLKSTGENRMNTKTTNIIKEIQKKVLSPATKTPEFKTTDEVIDAAVNEYYQSLKRKRIL
jgi:hypothetical protein